MLDSYDQARGVVLRKEPFGQELRQAAEKMVLVYGRCTNKLCRETDSVGVTSYDSSGSLVTGVLGEFPVMATECTANREGLLCGRCTPGYALTMYSATVSNMRYAHSASHM